MDAFRNAYILTGPTGSGKTRLGLELAERLGAEIVSMDSMALYRRMDIGTAKPSVAERQRVPHHLVDVLEPWESASVAWWLERARACVIDIEGRGKRVLFVGGTPLYLKALLCGLFDGPPADLALRARLEAEAVERGKESLHAQLAAVDPTTAARLHPNDVRRIVRALEVWQLTGRRISEWQQQWGGARGEGRGARGEGRGETEERSATSASDSSLAPRPSPLAPRPSPLAPRPSLCLYLDLPRPVLYERINTRVERMIAEGLVEEVGRLRQLEQPPSREATQALGYKELFDHLDGKTTLGDAIERIATRSRNFAKRQLTWFRHLPECRPATEELTFALWGLTIKRERV